MKRRVLKTPYLRLHVDREPSKRSSTRADIVAAVCRECKSGHLPPGSRLPPVRVLQHQLGISKNTAHNAYEDLVAQGVLINRKRLGYFVATPALARSTRPPVTAAAAALLQVRRPAPVTAKSSRSAHSPIHLGRVFIDPQLLPRDRMAECFRAVLRVRGLEADYHKQGFAPLRSIIAQRLVKRGIPAHSDDVIITTGSQQALDVATRALQNRSIATENPAYGIAKLLFEMNQMQVTGLPLDPFSGPDLRVWRRMIALARPALLYVTSNFQNPTGYSYSTTQLMQLLELSQEFQFGIVEDDWGSDMLSFSEFRPPLRALGGQNVLYVNSFTKKLLPSLRIGYLLANEKNREALLAAKEVATLANPTLIEAALYEFLQRGYYDTHLRTLQSELDQRYRACLDTLQEVMPADVRWTTPGGGPILWLEIPRKVDMHRLSARLWERNVVLDTRVREWFFGEPHSHGTRISYACAATAQLRRGLEILADGIRSELQ